MTWNYAYTPQIWPSLLTVLLMLAMALYGAHRRRVAGALPFMIGALFGAAWAAGSVMEYSAVDLGTKIFWLRFQMACQLPAVTTATCFVLEYAWPGRWLTRRNLALLSIAPLLVLGLIITDDLLHFLWRSSKLDGLVVTPLLGPGGWVIIAYSFGLVILSLVVLTWLFLRSPQHRWPVVIMVAGHIGVRTMYMLEKANLVSTTLPLDVLGLAFIIVMYAIALFGFRLFDPIPLARQTTIEQLRDGMLVLDLQGRVAGMNPAAVAILGSTEKQLLGRPIQDLLPSCVFPQDNRVGEYQISLGTGPETRYYVLVTSPLKDWRGLEIGRLLLLHDETARKRAETTLREAEEIQRLIFENASDGIAIYEEFPDRGERKLLACNERYAEMAGRSREELLAIGDTARIQKPLAPVPYAKPRREGWSAQSEGFFSWARLDGRQNTIEYNAASIQAGGRLLTIGLDRDVTERIQAQAQILEQQRALATLNEREHLARELHDGLGQALAAVHLQASAARRLLDRGETTQVGECLDTLANTTLQAEADMREYLLGAQSVVSAGQSFLVTLREYLKRFTRQFGLPVELSVLPELEGQDLPQGIAVQLLRIIQEGLSNIRKHAHAGCAQVSLTVSGGLLQAIISDDGLGFDAPAVVTQPGAGFGLRSMRERAEALGGVLQIDSAPGKGTQVVVEVPVSSNGSFMEAT